MKRIAFYRMTVRLMVPVLSILLLFSGIEPANGQGAGEFVVNLAPLDGLGLTPENIFSYSIQSNVAATTKANVKGTVRYRQSGLSFSYTFQTTIRQGINQMNSAGTGAQWTFSVSALRELFMEYHMLPQGTYEYCVQVTPLSSTGEMQPGAEVMECLYKTADDIFLINLTEPENDAKLYEHFPVFSWIVNYPFASQLTYRIRVAEIKDGQNTASAVSRNNPVYAESNLPQTTTTYPVYSKPLVTFQPYGWTVDAYYKGILLGGAEPWKFTIIEDSEFVALPRESPFVDIRKEQNASGLYAVGKIKLKYVESEHAEDVLYLRLWNSRGEEIKLPENQLKAVLGDNRYELVLKDKVPLKHLQRYTLEIKTGQGEKFIVVVKYVNPDFLK